VNCNFRGTLFASAILMLAPVCAYAGAFAVREQSAVGQGMAFAGEGTPSMGLSAMFWNPAAVTYATGFQSEIHATGLFPDLKITTLPGSSRALLALGSRSVDTGRTALLGSVYAGYQYNQNIYFGMVVSAPFGQKTVAPTPWPGQNLSVRAEAKSLEANPIAGYRLDDTISAALGLRVINASGKISRALAPSATDRRTRHIRHCRRLERWYYGHSLDGHGDRVRLPVSAEHNTRRYNELAASSAPPWRFQRNWPDTAAGPSHTRGAATHQRLRGPSGYGRMAKLEPSSRPATYIHLRSGRWKSGHYARIRFP